jgi:probable selenium-dependent hydroxylase accessory protein YqeC
MQLAEALALGSREVIALVGGGGKTTLMFALAAELSAAGRNVVTTTSTRLSIKQALAAPERIVQADPLRLLDELSQALLRSRNVLVVSEIIPALDKALGPSVSVIERIAALPEVDFLIVESDGAHERPFKAPAAHEPVIPESATLVVPVVGLDVLGRPLTTEFVHRPEIVADLAHAAIGDPVSTSVVANVLAHNQGGAKCVPATARLAPFLNKSDALPVPGDADDLARLLLTHPCIDRVLIGSASAPDPVRAVWLRSGNGLPLRSTAVPDRGPNPVQFVHVGRDLL